MLPAHLPRRSFLQIASVAGAALLVPRALRSATALPPFVFDPTPDIIKAPRDPALWPKYREQLAAWRPQRRQELNYSDALYRRPDLVWAASSFACYFLMLCDERFYDAADGRYRTKEWLAGLQRDFGGCDSVVLWHAYPRIGLDERNQFDFYRDVPGGLPGLRAVVDELRQAGMRTYINYNPWDTGTRREGRGDVDMLVEFVAALGVDGIFLDTMKEGAVDFREKLDRVRPGVVLEGEIALPMERITDHHQAWAQGFIDSEVPGVVRNKWFERRHQLHHVSRFNRDRTAQFQTAFMNGTGTMVWDNIFGTWNGFSEREKTILRAMLSIQRQFSGLFTGEQWTPLVPVSAAEVYASLWEAPGIRLWTLVNRAERATAGDLLAANLQAGEQLWDLVAGREVSSANTPVAPRGIGCFVAAKPAALGPSFEAFLQRQRAFVERADWGTDFSSWVQTKLKSAPRTIGHGTKSIPPAMALIPGGPFRFAVSFRPREVGEYESTHPRTVNQSFDWGVTAVSWVVRDVVVPAYAMDLTPVTNAQFGVFLRESRYQPRHAEKFLMHWRDGKIPAGQEEHPVVFIDLGDARAYAQWAGKRLPTEEEWQFAAQGTDARRYPWGNELGEDRCNGNGTGTTPVKQFPAGRSPFGIYDLCGNTWEWTESERTDGINRFAVIRGGSYYKAVGSRWYMDGGPVQNTFAAKFLLTWPGLDRCSTVGFRCVVDLE